MRPHEYVHVAPIGMDADESYMDVFMRFSQTPEQQGPALNRLLINNDG